MNRIVDMFVRATWSWAALLCSLAFCASARAVPASLVTTATGPLATVLEAYVTELAGGSAPGIELVAVGHSPSGHVEIARARLASSIRREPAPHRISRLAGEPAHWEACWRIVDHARPGGSVGCLRRRVRGNNHPDLGHPPEGFLLVPWRFDVPSQRFHYDPAGVTPLPVPHPLPARAGWANRAFHIPLPLSRITPAVLKRALRARGADVSPTAESAGALILPDRCDVCAFDRASHPAVILPALRRGVPVVWERSLSGLIAP